LLSSSCSAASEEAMMCVSLSTARSVKYMRQKESGQDVCCLSYWCSRLVAVRRADVSGPCPAVIGPHSQSITITKQLPFTLKQGNHHTITQIMAHLTLRSHLSRCLIRNFHTTRPTYSKLNVEDLLSKPTWSLDTLLPSSASSTETPTITSKQLHHLLRLSALPPPTDSLAEQKMLDSLHSHLHFVTHIRSVDTTNITPLQSLRDETSTGIKDQEIGLKDLEDAFSKEEVKGRYYKRIRRRQEDTEEGESAQNWDVLGSAKKKVGRFFVVDGGKDA
jgi:hypothetical protein